MTVIFAAADAVLGKVFVASLMNERYKIATMIATGTRHCRIFPTGGMVVIVVVVVVSGKGCLRERCDEGSPFVFKAHRGTLTQKWGQGVKGARSGPLASQSPITGITAGVNKSLQRAQSARYKFNISQNELQN